MKRFAIILMLSLTFPCVSRGQFEAGAAKAEITPPTGYAMWGYAARKDKPSTGVRDPLFARVLVLRAGDSKIALVGLDLGRAPIRDSMARIREKLKADGFSELFLVGSHTHHGPVIEVETWPKDKPYVKDLEEKLVATIRKADAARKPAKYGVDSTEVTLNRNRQSKRGKDAPVDRELTVLRVETLDGKPIAHAVNFAAHPTMLPTGLMEFSADYPGAMAKRVEDETGAPCLFLQGAAGDMSPNPPEGVKGPDEFGKKLGDTVLQLAKTIKMTGKGLTLDTRREEFEFKVMIDVNNLVVRAALEQAFFPDLIAFFQKEYAKGVRPVVTAALFDNSFGIVGVSGELFSEHAVWLKRRSRLPHVMVLGYCNDYQQYFPTIQAVSEGGYGTGLPVSVAELGAGEKMMDRALIHLYRMRGLIP